MCVGRPRRAIQHRVLVGKAHEPAVSVKDVHMAAAAERAGREWRHEVAGIEPFERAGPGRAHVRSLPMGRAILPVGRGMFGAHNKNHPVVHRAGRHDTAAGPVLRLIQPFDPSRIDLDPFDPRAVEHSTIGARSGVVDDPPGVGRPDGHIGEHVAVGRTGDLSLMHRCSIPQMRHSYDRVESTSSSFSATPSSLTAANSPRSRSRGTASVKSTL